MPRAPSLLILVRKPWVMPLEEAVVLLQEAEEERVEADRELRAVLEKLGFGGWHVE